MDILKTWWLLAVALVLNAAGNVLMKIGSKISMGNPLSGEPGFFARTLHFLNAATVIGIILFAANVLVYRKALNNLDISVAYPVMVSLGLVLVTITAIWLPMLDEKVSLMQIIGMVVICVGVWLVVRF